MKKIKQHIVRVLLLCTVSVSVGYAMQSIGSDSALYCCDEKIFNNERDVDVLAAATRRDLAGLRRLLDDCNADPNACGKYGETALMKASWFGYVDIVKELISHRALVNAQDEDGETALMKASLRGNVEVVRELLLHGALANVQDKHGWTALISPSLAGHVDVVKELLLHGALVNVQNNDGETALMIAAKFGRGDVVKILLAYGADMYIQTPNGIGARDCAHVRGHDAVMDVLRREHIKNIVADEWRDGLPEAGQTSCPLEVIKEEIMPFVE